MQSKETLNLADTIKGEINRMCVTDDLAELDTMSCQECKYWEYIAKEWQCSVVKCQYEQEGED